MKQIFTIAVVLTGFFLLTSCDETIEFDTNLETTILADVDDNTSGTKSSLKESVSYPFSAEAELDITDNSEVNDYIDRLNEIKVKSITCTFSGIPEGESIITVTISVEGAGLAITLEDIADGDSVTLDISPELLNTVSELITDNHEIIISVSGASTYAPMTLSTLVSASASVSAMIIQTGL
jgi:hypothetical protein